MQCAITSNWLTLSCLEAACGVQQDVLVNAAACTKWGPPVICCEPRSSLLHAQQQQLFSTPEIPSYIQDILLCCFTCMHLVESARQVDCITLHAADFCLSMCSAIVKELEPRCEALQQLQQRDEDLAADRDVLCHALSDLEDNEAAQEAAQHLFQVSCSSSVASGAWLLLPPPPSLLNLSAYHSLNVNL